MRPFAVFDIDGTLIRWQLYHAITDALARRGNIEPKIYEALRKARLEWKKRTGETSFKNYEEQLVAAYEKILEDISVGQIAKAAEEVFDEYKDQVYTYTRDLVKGLKEQGYMLFAISGSQIEIVAKVAGHYGFDDFVGTVYKHDGQKFTGAKEVGSFHKDKTLRRLVEKHGLDFDKSFAIGDSKSDIAMLELVENPIAFNPEKELFEYAKAKGWKVVIERKNVIYELHPGDNGQYLLA